MTTRPTIVTVDDDAAVSQAISRDLRARYGAEYRIVRATSGAAALTVLAELALRDRPVALIVSDQRMPGMTGIELLAQAHTHAPGARLALLTAYADTQVAIRAINEIGLDHYLMKPWDPPSERLYPVIDDLLADWQRANRGHTADVRVVGDRWSPHAHEIKTFLARNHVPYSWFDVERDEEGRRLVVVANAGPETLPLVLLPEQPALTRPSTLALATALGLRTRAEQPLYDVCIVGSGPAGLAAAVYAASEGLSTVLVDREAPGGQAGQSASIENYLGFPKGLSGADLTQRAVAQAARFGAEMVLARDAVRFERRGPVRAVVFDDRHGDSAEIEARALVIATGVEYRRLSAADLDAFTGRGVYYGATASEASGCAGDDVYVVGAANSAGQAALNLAAHARRVVLVVRGSSIEESMSAYLVDRVLTSPTIEVRLRTEVIAGGGDGHLEHLTLAERDTGRQDEVRAQWLFVFIGAEPHTEWLGDQVARSPHGFLITGNELLDPVIRPLWELQRAPFALETSVPGVFAAGDVRLDSMKRVASAVGEGAMSVSNVHSYLATT